MPSLVCAPPEVLDQSFPRSKKRLELVVLALGTLDEVIRADRARLVLTALLRDVVEEFSHENCEGRAERYEVYNYLAAFCGQPNDGVVDLDVSGVEEYEPHPLPEGCDNDDGLADFCADELGRLLQYHDRFVRAAEYFIGIVCVEAFSGGTLCRYPAGQWARRFPLVGPDLDCLEDAYVWDVPANTRNRSVSFSAAKANCRALGAIRVEPPSSGSHYKVYFSNGSRPWILDRNDDPVPKPYLSELRQITGFPLEAVIHGLLTGQPPRAKRGRWEEPN